MTSKYKPRNFFGDEVETRKQKKTTIKDSFMWLIFIWEMLFTNNNKQKSKPKEPNGIRDIAIMVAVIVALIIFS